MYATYATNNPVNLSDPSGKTTTGVCIEVYAQASFRAAGSMVFASDCVVWNFGKTLSLTATWGTGHMGGLSAEVNVAAGVQLSNAGGVSTLAGKFDFQISSASFGVGMSQTESKSLGSGSTRVVDEMASLGASVGIGTGTGVSTTQIAAKTTLGTVANDFASIVNGGSDILSALISASVSPPSPAAAYHLVSSAFKQKGLILNSIHKPSHALKPSGARCASASRN